MRSAMEMRSGVTSCAMESLRRDSSFWNASIMAMAGKGASGASPVDVRGDLHPARKHVAPRDAARGQLLARGAKLLVLEQAAHELDARVFALVGVGVDVEALVGRRRRQQHPRLDVRERRGHEQVLGREVEVERLHHRVTYVR
jgi:hypothetical protein